jgi:hypothetical protein
VKFITEPVYSAGIGKRVRLFEWESGEVWVAYEHPDGNWVSLRKATQPDIFALKRGTEIDKEAT